MAHLKGNLDRMAATTSETMPIVLGPKGPDYTVIVIGAGAAGLAAAGAACGSSCLKRSRGSPNRGDGGTRS